MASLIFWFVALTLLLVAPRKAALALVFVTVAFEGSATDFTSVVSEGLYRLDPMVASFLPGTMEPIGLFAILLCIRLYRMNDPERLALMRPLPKLALLVPPAYFASIAWGLTHGGQLNFAYHESRGLLVGAATFIAVRSMKPLEARTAIKLVFWSAGALAAILLYRYTFVARGDETVVNHESVNFLAIGITLALLRFAQAPPGSNRVLTALLLVFLLAGTLATGKRSGTLVVLIAVCAMAAILISRFPLRVMVLSALFAVMLGAYVAAFWGSTGGLIGQPARAIRSQFQPDARESSSDEYRRIEKFNVVMTLKGSPVFGVGMGRPYIVYWPTWVAPNWPLQFYMPHINLLWFWLKFGILGIAVLGGVWALGLGNAIRAARSPLYPGVGVLPITIAAALMIYMQFMEVDVATNERAMVPLGILLGMALSLPDSVAAFARAPVPAVPSTPAQLVLVGAEAPTRRPRPNAPRYFPGAVS